MAYPDAPTYPFVRVRAEEAAAVRAALVGLRLPESTEVQFDAARLETTPRSSPPGTMIWPPSAIKLDLVDRMLKLGAEVHAIEGLVQTEGALPKAIGKHVT